MFGHTGGGFDIASSLVAIVMAASPQSEAIHVAATSGLTRASAASNGKANASSRIGGRRLGGVSSASTPIAATDDAMAVSGGGGWCVDARGARRWHAVLTGLRDINCPIGNVHNILGVVVPAMEVIDYSGRCTKVIVSHVEGRLRGRQGETRRRCNHSVSCSIGRVQQVLGVVGPAAKLVGLEGVP